MKWPARLLTLILAFLFAIPNKFPESIKTVVRINGAFAQAYTEEECRSKAGWNWISQNGHATCVQDQDLANLEAGAAQCATLPENEQRECFQRNANKNVESSSAVKAKDGSMFEGEYKGGGMINSSTIPLIITILTTFYFIKAEVAGVSNECPNTSVWLLFAGGIAAALGEITANVYYRTKLRDLIKKYRNQTNSSLAEGESDERRSSDEVTSSEFEEAANEQKEAFTYLINQEKARSNAALYRSIAYGTAGGIYTAALIAALVEVASSSNPVTGGIAGTYKPCLVPSSRVETLNNSFITSAWGALGLGAGIAGYQLKDTAVEPAVKWGEEPSAEPNLIEELAPSFSRYTPMQKVNETELKQKMSYSVDYYKEISVKHPLKTFSESTIDEGTYDLRKMAGFGYSYNEATTEEHVEMLNRMIRFLMPEAFAQSAQSTGKDLDRTGELLQNNGKVVNDKGVGTEILLEFAKLVINVLTFGGAVMGLNAIISHTAGADKSLDGMFMHPASRGVIAGLMAGYAFIVMGSNIGVMSNADERIKVLERIRARIENVDPMFDGCEDHDKVPAPGDSRQLICYCYTNGEKTRSASDICSRVYGEGGIPDGNFWGSLGATELQNTGQCIDEQNKIHEEKSCPCRETGKCKRLPRVKGNIGDLGAAKLYDDYAAAINKDWSGNTEASDIAAAGERTNQALKILEKLKKDKKLAPELAKVKKKQKKFENEFGSYVGKAFPKGANRFMASSATAKLGSPADIAQAVKEAVKKDALQFESKGKSPGVAGGAKDNFDFSFDSSPTASENVAEVMKDNYKFDDINNNTDASIFKILSIRYHSSGLRRLFGDELPQEDKQIDSKE